MCIKNDNHMRYGSWDTEWDRQKFLSFWTSFCPFTLLSQKIFFWKNKMSISRCHHFTHLYQKSRYYVCFLRYGVQQKNFCDFKQFFALLPNYWPQKLKFGKKCKKIKKKTNPFYYPLTYAYHKLRWYDVWFLRYTGMTDRVFCHFGPFFNLWAS